MSLERSIQKGISDFSFIIGTGLKYGGAGSLLVMAIVGTAAIDIVKLAAVANSRNHNNDFLTGYVLGSMFYGRAFDPLPLLVISPITSLIAVALSVPLGVPMVGAAILAGWAAAAIILGVGLGLTALAEAIRPEPEKDDDLSCWSFCTP